MSDLIPVGRLWAELSKSAAKLDGGWLRKHPNAQLVDYAQTSNGLRLEWECGSEHHTYLTTDLGKPIEVR